MFFKIGVVKNFAIFSGKQLSKSLFLIKLELYFKETPAQDFSCEYCKIFKNSNFYGTTLVTNCLLAESGFSFNFLVAKFGC